MTERLPAIAIISAGNLATSWTDAIPGHAGSGWPLFWHHQFAQDLSRRDIRLLSNDEFLLFGHRRESGLLGCGAAMMVQAREAKPDFIIFRCRTCGRSEKYICEE